MGPWKLDNAVPIVYFRALDSDQCRRRGAESSSQSSFFEKAGAPLPQERGRHCPYKASILEQYYGAVPCQRRPFPPSAI